jgi:hypothetical protein
MTGFGRRVRTSRGQTPRSAKSIPNAGAKRRSFISMKIVCCIERPGMYPGAYGQSRNRGLGEGLRRLPLGGRTTGSAGPNHCGTFANVLRFEGRSPNVGRYRRDIDACGRATPRRRASLSRPIKGRRVAAVAPQKSAREFDCGEFTSDVESDGYQSTKISQARGQTRPQ